MSKELPVKSAVLYTLEALCHAVETYTSPMKNPLSDAYAFSALCIIRDNLHKSIKFAEDKKIRLALANASLLSSIAFINTEPTISHVLSDVLAEKYGVSHEEAICIIFTSFLNNNFSSTMNTLASFCFHLQDLRFTPTLCLMNVAESSCLW